MSTRKKNIHLKSNILEVLKEKATAMTISETKREHMYDTVPLKEMDVT